MGMILPGSSGTPEDHDEEPIPKIDGRRPSDTSRWTVTVAFLHVSRQPDTAKPRQHRKVMRRLTVAALLTSAVVVVAVTLMCGPAEAWRLVACAGNVFLTYFPGR
jgi:hypothetical protein